MSSDARFLRALACENVDRVPVWIMRQAGRYLPEYLKVRQKAGSFLNLCKTPGLAAEVTLQPLKRFPLDAAIIFSDILTIPDAYGLGLHFEENEGPVFVKPIQSLNDVQQLPLLEPEKDLNYVMEAIALVREKLSKNIPLIGFAGSPWTLATYMVEGAASKHFNLIKRFRYQTPEVLHLLLKHLTLSVSDYLYAQSKAGADVLMLFDTWGGILNVQDYPVFSMNYIKEVIANLRARQKLHTPIIVFTKNGGQMLSTMADSGCDAIGLDWTADLRVARKVLENRKVALQGNLDPGVLYAPKTVIRQKVQEILEIFNGAPGHIFNLGHGIPKDAPIDAVHAMIEAVQDLSPTFCSTPRK